MSMKLIFLSIEVSISNSDKRSMLTVKWKYAKTMDYLKAFLG